MSGTYRWSLALWPFAGFLLFMALPAQLVHVAWLPQIGFHFALRLDGLSRLFALLITGIGSLVFVYSAKYLAAHPGRNRFYGFITLFMASMLGLVLADDWLLMFVCWELTSISSFFLIAINHQEQAARKSAITALSVTGLGGMGLFGAAILFEGVTGSFQISTAGPALSAHFGQPTVQAALALLLLAAFTKSAQFPFHFWLPGAMAAPTPISTYLHSATMVKAGVYLLLRMSPSLTAHPWWGEVLVGFGALTMLYAAFHALFRTDMKAVLAYTTVAALGILVFLTGLGTPQALKAALVFVVVHALYKAALFLVTGGVDYALHTRNLLRLGGLYKALPAVAFAAFMAALLNGGFPPLLGFIGKDLMYEALMQHDRTLWLLPLLVATKVMLVYAGFQVGLRPFIGPAIDPRSVESVSPWLWVPPMFLALVGLLLGIFPSLFEPLLAEALQAVGVEHMSGLALWHGVNAVFGWSVVTLVLGTGLYFTWKLTESRGAWTSSLKGISPESIGNQLAFGLLTFAGMFTRFFQHGYLRYYVMSVVTVLVAGIGYRLFNNYVLQASFHPVLALTFYEIGVLVLMLAAIVFTVIAQSRLAAVAALGVLGLAICLIFVFYGAPDLAITQFTIDTLTVILFVLVLYKLPRYIRVSSMPVLVRDGMLSLSFGALISLLALLVLEQPVQRDISAFYAAQSYVAAKGKNVVNVILVDFRGLDTLVEITVLSIAAIGVYALLKLRLKVNERRNRA